MPPDWLPPILEIDNHEDVALPVLYGVFTADFKQGVIVFRNARVTWDTRMIYDGRYDAGFIHLVTKDGPPLMRRGLDEGRARRLRWCKATINNSTCESIKQWDYEESSGRVRTYLWLQDQNYVVILERRCRNGFEENFLVTAFHIDGSSTVRSLSQKYSRRRP